MGIINDVNELVPEMKEKCELFLTKCKEAGLSVRINETRREEITQVLYYLQGRLDEKNNSNIVAEFNNIRKAHKFWPLLASDAISKQITWTLKSKHMDGKAFDAVPRNEKGDWWNAPDDVWEKMGVIGESCGLKWGGRWKNKDSPHFEMA